jgi:hypothetical protein
MSHFRSFRTVVPRLARASAAITFIAVVAALPARAADPTLEFEPLSRLLKVVYDKGTQIELPPPLTTVLKLKERQYAPKIWQATYQSEDKVKHGFAPLNDKSGYLLFRRDPLGGLSLYVTAPDFHLVAAARSDRASGFVTIERDEAQSGLNDEVRHWADVLKPKPGLAPLPALLQHMQSTPTAPLLAPTAPPPAQKAP